MSYRAVALTVVLAVAGCNDDVETVPPSPAQTAAGALNQAPSFPPNFNYPLSVPVLDQAVAQRNESLIRQHGWYLFAGINVPSQGGLPLWRQWHTATAAYALPPSSPATNPRRSLRQANKDNVPVSVASPQYPVPQSVCTKYGLSNCPGPPGSRYQLADGSTFQNNGDIMIAGVIYNQEAFDWIRGNTLGGDPRFYEGDVLTRSLPPQGQMASMSAFPARAIVLKHMYWPVRGDACGALPVWDNPKPPTPSTYMGYENFKTAFPRAVAVATRGCPVPPGGRTKATFLHDVLDASGNPMPPVVFNNALVVPLTNFFHQTFSEADLDALDSQDRAILDASAWWAYGREFEAGDSVVSIATHIFTKEMPTWTIQTFWWHDNANVGPYAANRPSIPQVPPTWRNYLMASEYGIPDLGSPNQLPIRFNPYIELTSHPVATNCRNCHQRAAWPRSKLGMSPYAQYQLQSADPGLLTLLKPSDSLFKSLLLLDFQWALSDRALAPTVAPLAAP